MVAMNTRSATAWLGTALGRAAWESRRLAQAMSRRFGWPGWVVLAGLLLAATAAVQSRRQAVLLADAQHRLAEQHAAPVRALEPRGTDAAAKLLAFDDILLADSDIPELVRHLLELAEQEHLAIVRGDYKPQVDVPGRFMRYRMTLPVKGDAQAVHRFMLAALRAHRTLALESAQFKRERIESAEVEARIQWVVLTRLPGGELPAPAAKPAEGSSR